MTDTEMNELVAAIEHVLIEHGIHLTTDRFNTLHDFVSALVAAIKENGQ